MKKFLSFMFMVMSVTALFAQSVMKPNEVVFGHHAKNAMKVKKVASDEFLTTAPEGKSDIYYRTGRSFYDNSYQTILTRSDGSATCIVFTDDNKVYIQNPISRFITDTYIVGDVADNIITIKTPQLLGLVDDYGYYKKYYVQRMVLNEAGNNYCVDTSCNEIKLKVQDDGSIKQLDDNVLLGLVDDKGAWAYYGDYEMLFSPVTDKKVELPQTAVPEKWKMLWNGYNDTDIYVAFDNNDVYVKGLSVALPESYVKGSITDNGTVVFEKGQYLGADTLISEYHLYLGMGSVDTVYNEKTYQDEEVIHLMKSLPFRYDAEKKVMSSDSLLLLMGGKENLIITDRIDAPIFKYQKELVSPCKPLDPVFVYYKPYNPSDGYGMYQFDILREDVEGNIIPADSMKYCIYFDNELFTFMKDEYFFIPEEMTEIPYTYKDDFDFFVDGLTHTVFFYSQGFSKIGAQSIITINGEKTYSNIVYNTGGSTTGVDKVGSTATGVKRVEFYDLNGRRLAKPVSGVILKKVFYDNGDVKTTKIVR